MVPKELLSTKRRGILERLSFEERDEEREDDGQMLGRSSPTSPFFFQIDVDLPGSLDRHRIGIGLLLSVSVSVLGLCKEAVAVVSVTGFRCKVFPAHPP